MNITAYDLAQRWIGLKELPGSEDHPFILGMLRLDDDWPDHDEVPWCSAFVNFICWQLRLPRSKSLMARSWLDVGVPVDFDDASPGFDVVILNRPPNPQSGHVGFFAGLQYTHENGQQVHLLGGNQSNSVSVAPHDAARVIGVRRLWG